MADRLPPALPWARPEPEAEASAKRPRHAETQEGTTPATTQSLVAPLFGLQVGDRVEVLWDFADDEGGENYAQVCRHRCRAQSSPCFLTALQLVPV